ncbi:MAG: ADOP family duplicated permease [Terriglobales bacterium]
MKPGSLWLQLRALLRPRRAERDLQDEVTFHLAMEARKRQAAGEPAARAERQAAAAFGGADRVLEECRDTRGLRWLRDAGRDLRLALRRARRQPGFALLAVATLALGIGANTALFTLVEAAMLRPLPVPQPRQLVLVGDPQFNGLLSGTGSDEIPALTYAQYQSLRDQSHELARLAAFSSTTFNTQVSDGRDSATPATLQMVSANYFQVLGLQPARGRFFVAGEADSAAAPQAVLDYGYWQHHFGGDLSVIGKVLHLRTLTFTVIGVAPQGFVGTTVGLEPDLYFPLALQPRIMPGRDWLHDPPGVRRVLWITAIGRLRPGASLATARSEVAALYARSIAAQAALAPDARSRAELLTQRIPVVPAARGASAVSRDFGKPLWILFALVGLVLLMVGVNLSGMLLAQATAREREFAMRLALGARRSRLVRQLAAESLLLAGAGAAAGWWLAQAATHALVAMVAQQSDGLTLSATPDGTVLAFTLLLAVLTGMAMSLAPALRLTRRDLAARARRRQMASRGLVVAQVALSLVLVSGAALFARSLGQLRRVPLGFQPDNLYSFSLNAGTAGAGVARALQAYGDITTALQRLPGVTAVAASNSGLFTGQNSSDTLTVPGQAGPADAKMDFVSPGYFAALEIPILQGREFSPADTGRGPRPIILDQTFVDRFFAGRSPLGQTITVHFSDSSEACEVVGVAAPVIQYSLRQDRTDPQFYLDLYNGRDYPEVPGVYFEVRTRGPGTLSLPALNAAIQQASGLALPVHSLDSIAAMVNDSLAPDLLLLRLSGFFALLALGLAAMGLYAMLGWAVARRRHEIGLRMALGARAGQVTAMVLGEGLSLVAAGIAVGVGASLWLGQSLASLLFGVRPTDPASLATAALVLLAAGSLAALLPARRASRTDPARTLRLE